MSDVEEQAQQWRDESPYLIQRDLGIRVGVSSHVVGRLLDEIGVRQDKRPTNDAFKNKLAEVDRSGPWPQYKWNERQIVPLLRDRLSKKQDQVHK
ncbi:hypothetical protein Spb1_22700 [Planctopirus ephydatiae]|uniref:Uncharacterized protein n=1 Tax=Planctopirus ephydatiae TaxID=2528019 RepID=A0A518GPF6_9PLAN|nr:hypothetical protein [Planctopirus ephydatiae]QDV30341.1 hypothetical protein Spb1_22700 [Planctopirus ephydatiae]